MARSLMPLLLLFCFLNTCSSDRVSMSNEEYEFVKKILESDFDEDISDIYRRAYGLQYGLSEFHRFKLKSIRRGVDSIEASIEKYVRERRRGVKGARLSQENNYERVIDLIEIEHLRLSEIYFELLEEHSKTLHINDQDISQITSQVQKRNKELDIATAELKLFCTERYGSLLISFIDRLFLLSKNQLLEHFEHLVFSSSYCGFEVFYPVIVNNEYDPNIMLGDSLKLRVGVGSYYNIVDPTTTTFLVNGDTIELEDAGIGYYNKLMTEEGKEEIKLEFWMKNYITGETMNGESKYIVRVNK